MSYYKNLEGTDVIQNVGLVTSGIFQDGASSITQFHTSSTQCLFITLYVFILTTDFIKLMCNLLWFITMSINIILSNSIVD